MPKLTPRQHWSYAAFALPLAFAALPTYLLIPTLYADTYQLSLTLLGTILLCTRLFDALLDPLIGEWIDRPHPLGIVRVCALGIPILLVGSWLLFNPPTKLWLPSSSAQLTWLVVGLLVTYIGFSLCNIAYQAWGAWLGNQTNHDAARSAITTHREGLGLLGVVLASVLPALLGMLGLSLILTVLLTLSGLVLLRYVPRPSRNPNTKDTFTPTTEAPLERTQHHAQHRTAKQLIQAWQRCLQHRPFQILLTVFLFSTIAASFPATLVVFYIRDALQLEAYQGLFLALYFLSGAFSMPLWQSLTQRIGLVRAWQISMLLAILVFIWAAFVPGVASAETRLLIFAGICLLSGIALGGDLALPPALLARVIQTNAKNNSQKNLQYSTPYGTYFGLWNWASKFNLALAAGIALPLVEQLGYQNGNSSAHSIQSLLWAYAALPCALKLLAAFILWRHQESLHA